MLELKSLKVAVNGTEILKGINYKILLGNNYAFLGKNGSGKSSLAMSIMGNPNYEIVDGDILLNGTSIKDLTPDLRSKNGIFLAFQNIPEIPGVKVFEFLKSVYNAHKDDSQKVISFIKFKKILEPLVEEIGLDKDFLFRDLNVGFSGGEKRKLEILQMKLINPKLIILDEIDSGLDINSIKSLGELLKQIDGPDNSIIIISHYFDILDYIPIYEYVVLESGKIKYSADQSILNKIKETGF